MILSVERYRSGLISFDKMWRLGKHGIQSSNTIRKTKHKPSKYGEKQRRKVENYSRGRYYSYSDRKISRSCETGFINSRSNLHSHRTTDMNHWGHPLCGHCNNRFCIAYDLYFRRNYNKYTPQRRKCDLFHSLRTTIRKMNRLASTSSL